MPLGDDEELKYRVTLDTDDYEDGQKKIRKETDKTGKTIKKSNEENIDSIADFDKKLKNMVLAGGGLYVLNVGLRSAAQATKFALEVASRYDAALIGLTETARGYNQSTIEATEAAKELSRDGLLTIEESAQSIKNLLGAGFSVSEAFEIAKSMKDIGAFNNVVGDLGQAMVDSSKGIKTGSIELIENIGLTERLSVTMKKANVDISDGINLVDNRAQRQAVYNSIIVQGNKFQDNANKLTNTYEGSTKKLNAAQSNLANTMGKILQPAAQKYNELLTGLFKNTEKLIESETRRKKLLTSLRTVYAVSTFGISEILVATNGALIENELYNASQEKSLTIFEQNIEMYKKQALEIENRKNKTVQIIKLEKDTVRKNETEKNNFLETAFRERETLRQLENDKLADKEEEQKRLRDNQLNIENSYQQKILELTEEASEQRTEQQIKRVEFDKSEEQRQKNINQIRLDEQNRAFAERMTGLETVQQDEINALEEQERKKLAIQKKFAVASNALTEKLMKGELKSIDDLKEIVNLQVQAIAQGKVAELSMTAVTEGVLSVAAFASGNAAKGSAHAGAAGQAVAGAALIASLAGVANRALGGGDSATTTEAGNETVQQAETVTTTTEPKQTITYEVPSDSEIFKAMLPKLDQAAKDEYDIRIISR